jgi:hypothetical protein
MNAEEFEHRFEEGVELTASLDLPNAKRILEEHKRVNADFPTWMIDSVEHEACKLG